MSETSPESSSKQRRFSEEFKQDAVRPVVQEKYSFEAAAKPVGASSQALRQWHARLAPKPTECGADATLDELQEENKRLRRELRRAEMEREILKKRRRTSRRSRSEIRLDPRTSRLVPRGRRLPGAGGLDLRLLRLV